MPNIIRIRDLVEESNLNDIIFPVDKRTYLDDAHRISIDDLKEWILSGYTGGGGGTGMTSGTSGIDGVDGTSGTTPCNPISSNYIRVEITSGVCSIDGIMLCVDLEGEIDCDF